MAGDVERNVGRGLLSEVLAKLNSGEGLTVAEFEEKRFLRVAPGITLEEFITGLVNSLEVESKNGRIVKNKELGAARRAYEQAVVEAQAGSVEASRLLKLPELHDSHQ